MYVCVLFCILSESAHLRDVDVSCVLAAAVAEAVFFCGVVCVFFCVVCTVILHGVRLICCTLFFVSASSSSSIHCVVLVCLLRNQRE